MPETDIDLVAEYNAALAYHTSTVTNRFTTALLYMTASGFLAGAVFKNEVLLPFRILMSAFAVVVTLSVWAVELRNRQIVVMIAGRAREIERVWLRDQAYRGLLSRQAPHLKEFADDPKLDHSYRVFTLRSSRLPKPVLERINHSYAFDVLYMSGLLLWVLGFTGLTWIWLAGKLHT